MKLHNLKPAAGSTHSRRRVGRGPGSGLGGTSTRGHKGAKARSGYKRKIGLAELVAAGITNGKKLVKILGKGELKSKIDVEANAFSKSAEEAIKAAGGNTTII